MVYAVLRNNYTFGLILKAKIDFGARMFRVKNNEIIKVAENWPCKSFWACKLEGESNTMVFYLAIICHILATFKCLLCISNYEHIYVKIVI